jgi:murein DD-endopeptidase MepM/ murein hydrolase activator NlpD
MRALLVTLAFVALVVVLVTRAEPLGPSATLDGPVDVIGRGTPVPVLAHDRGSGLARVEVRLVPGDGGTPVVLAAEEFPRLSWSGSSVYDATLTPTVGADVKLSEGPATLEVWAEDHSWLSALRSGPRLSHPVTVDLTPPTISVLTAQQVARLGGSETIVFRVSDDAVESGVRVGEAFFPATPGFFADPQLRVALFAIPQDAGDARPMVVAADRAGNWREAPLDIEIRPRRFADKTLELSEEFLSKKVPELLQANGLDQGGTLVEGYLRINRDLRKSTEVKVREICRDSASTPLWEGSFVRLPNGAPLSGFADRRAYAHKGEIIDHQTHLGFDLASLKRAVVPAANGGQVVFAGPLGIYGDTVILDHGMGLFTLYGHLSEISVTNGASVKRGDPIGKTGETGLAGGDHLHFSTMIRGIHVDPVEWWDDHWIQDHVALRLGSQPRAAVAAPAAKPEATPGPAS